MKLNSNHMVYKQHDTQCSGPQLVLLLCDGAIRYTKDAAEHMRHQRWAEKGIAIEAAHDCISELRKMLDLHQGGEVSKNLDRTYDLLSTKLTLANTARDPEQLDQVVAAVTTIRESWSELFQRLAKEGKLSEKEIAPKALEPAL